MIASADIELACNLARERVTPELYQQAKEVLLAIDPDAHRMLDWSTTVQAPETPEHLASEIIWIILCAGRSAQAARTIEKKVWAAINDGRPAVQAFGYRAKADAIDRAWRERQADFAAFQRARAAGAMELLEWCRSIPFVGDTTCFQLAKNAGARVCKPDIWMARLAGIADKPLRPTRLRFPVCQAMCEAIELATGDPVPVVDSVLWLGSSKGVLQVGPDAGPITLTAEVPGRRSIFTAAPAQ